MSRTSIRGLRGALIAALVAGLAGCVTTTRTPLSDAHRAAIASTQVHSNVPQEELGTSIVISNISTGSGGLLVALITSAIDAGVNNHRTNDAETAAAPIRSALMGLDTRAVVTKTLQEGITQNELFKGVAIVPHAEAKLDQATFIRFVDSVSGTDAVFVVNFEYRLSPTRDAINVSAAATLLPTKEAASPELKKVASAPPPQQFQFLPCPPLYRVVLHSTVPAPQGEGTAEERWAANDGAAARKAIEGGVAEVVRMLMWDLQQPGPKGQSYVVVGHQGMKIPALPWQDVLWYVLDSSGAPEGRTWARSPSGDLASFGDAYP
jgi:hypothetical protein